MLTGDFLRNRRRRELSDEDLAILEDSISEVRDFGPRYTISRRGEVLDASIFLIDGLVGRYLLDQEGERQLLALHLTGEFIDLHGFPLRWLDHDVVTLTQARVGIVPHERLAWIVDNRPNLTRLLWFSTLIDASVHREWIFRIGRLNAMGRVGHFLSELNLRLQSLGLSGDERFNIDLIQGDIAEACGLTSVHVNRVLRKLRERGVITFRNGEAIIHDRALLYSLSDFDPTYLYFDWDSPRN
jgi:CRP-like cAMP-binding protein